MRIELGPGESIAKVDLALTPGEAAELRDALVQLLKEQDFEGHHHVSSSDYQTEISVRLDRE